MIANNAGSLTTLPPGGREGAAVSHRHASEFFLRSLGQISIVCRRQRNFQEDRAQENSRKESARVEEELSSARFDLPPDRQSPRN
jgi:hypothetical protein